jgi:hypothetical protein
VEGRLLLDWPLRLVCILAIGTTSKSVGTLKNRVCHMAQSCGYKDYLVTSDSGSQCYA